jgi:hypothetical protein
LTAKTRTRTLVAPIFTIRDAGSARRQIRYLACEVTAPGVLQALASSGQRSGASPDSAAAEWNRLNQGNRLNQETKK